MQEVVAVHMVAGTWVVDENNTEEVVHLEDVQPFIAGTTAATVECGGRTFHAQVHLVVGVGGFGYVTTKDLDATAIQ